MQDDNKREYKTNAVEEQHNEEMLYEQSLTEETLNDELPQPKLQEVEQAEAHNEEPPAPPEPLKEELTQAAAAHSEEPTLSPELHKEEVLAKGHGEEALSQTEANGEKLLHEKQHEEILPPEETHGMHPTKEIVNKKPTDEEMYHEKHNPAINNPLRDTNNPLRDTIFGEEDSDKAALAEINFDLVDAGRWLLKVIAGPNNGAEFLMHSASSYVIGTDPTSCDIVFHDTSVSRQHARITLGTDEGMTIEDLKSRNQTLVEGEPIKTKTKLTPNAVVTIGTTMFTVYDREGEMQTIISPLLPAIVKVLKEEPQKAEPTAPLSPTSTQEAASIASKAEELSTTSLPSKTPEKTAHAIGAIIVLGIVAGLFVIIGLGTASLFKNEPVVVERETHSTEILNEALKQFPSITSWYNKSTGTLQLMGHVLTPADKSRLIYSLRGLPFVKGIDDNGVIIDEYVWQETNQVLSKSPIWKSITISSPSPGKFILSGYLQTRNQADQLSEYIASNFPYIDLLEKRITVEEDVVSKANNIFQNAGFREIVIKMENGTLTLTGGFAQDKEEGLQSTIEDLRKIPGVRDIKNLTLKLAPEQSIINISDKYEVTGFSRLGSTYSVVIHGRILTKGDELDGMQITEIRKNAILLEKDGVKYRIDFSR